MIGEIYQNKTPVSHYQPSKEIADFTNYVKKDYSQGNEILHRNWTELNNRSIVDDQDRGKRTFNAFVDEDIEDPATAWQWRGTRSKARNQAIALHAQLTAGYIVPMFMAQNDDDEEDMDFSEVMRDTVEWMINNSNYKDSFLQVTMGMLVNPVTFMGADFANVFQTIKTKLATGKYQTEQVLDEVLSGFQAPIYGATEVLISNAYEQNIQKHRFNIKRRYIEYGEAQAKYNKHDNWIFVQPGIKSLYSDDDGLFYDLKDDDHDFLVEEVTYQNRRDDTEVCFLNGIYMGNMESVEWNPIRHRDNKNAPKYNIVPFGYQRVNEHYFYYKSLMNSQYWDNQLLDAQYQIGMNRAFLDANMPIAISGTDKVDSDVIFPSSVVAFEDPNTKVSPLLPQANLAGIFSAMEKVESSMDESGVSATSQGQLPQASQKATSVAIASRNAETLIKGVGKNLAQSVVQVGDLMKDIAIQHLVVPQVDEILGENVKLKYKTLTLQNKVIDGREVSKILRFDESLLGNNMTEKQKRSRSMALLEETGYPKLKKHIYQINPELFSRFKYLTKVEPEKMFPENEEYKQAIMSQIYAQFAENPFISLEALTRKTLYATFRSETEELMKKEEDTPQAPPEEGGGGGAKQTQFGQQAQNQATSSSIQGIGQV
jgi:hypothetical protein